MRTERYRLRLETDAEYGYAIGKKVVYAMADTRAAVYLLETFE